MVSVKHRLLLALSAGLLALVLPACKRASPPAPDKTIAEGETAEKRYPLTGEVIKIDAERRTLFVRHEAIPDLMPAMTMEFAVSAGDLANAKEGQHIRAELVMDKNADARLEKILAVDPVAEATVRAAADSLRQDTAIRGKSAYREIGEALPDFALYDQNGKVVSAMRFRGKQVMLNFIFTRCPVATMCPASTAKMVTSQRQAREAGVANIEFISITLDPNYDTPGVLKDYALTRGIDLANFSLLTGPEKAIKDLLTQFGILSEFDGSILKHTLATLLIDEQGKIVWRADGSQWSPDAFVAKMHKGAP